MPADSTVFVTVGTTSFDRLIETISGTEICEALQSKGYQSMTVQYGRGSIEPPDCSSSGFPITHYRYKDSIQSDIKTADLVISHAGAGSVLETLNAGKPLIVVINEDLMNNHQLEVAEQLGKDNHLVYTTCRKLATTLQEMDVHKLKPLEPGQPAKFASFLDQVMGFS